jgi:serine/threonine-protein kinase
MAALGTIVGRRYTLLQRIGKGGYCVVYRATDLHALEEVAVKILHDGTLRGKGLVERMEREYRVLRELDGTAATRVAGIYKEGNDVCLVMELLKGRDLDEHLCRLDESSKRPDLPDLVKWLDPVVRTLETAHDRAIVHRDLKPGNIFLVDGPHPVGVRLLDFGLASVGSSSPITDDGMVIGSPSYIAPEVWAGNPRALDHRVDVYSMGAIVFRALTGHAPFPGPGLRDRLEQVTKAERPSLRRLRPDLPPAIDDWTRQVLAIEPAERFSTVRAMWNALFDSVKIERPRARAMVIGAP